MARTSANFLRHSHLRLRAAVAAVDPRSGVNRRLLAVNSRSEADRRLAEDRRSEADPRLAVDRR